MRPLKTWLYLSPTQKRTFREATLALLRARLWIKKPFKTISTTLGHPQAEGFHQTLDLNTLAELRLIRTSISVMSRYVPWQSKCLVQALAAQQMLNRRGIEYTLYLGVQKNQEEMKAHAWLRVGRYFITGGQGHASYTPVQSYFSPS